MKMEYWISVDGKWVQTNLETYTDFKGEKQTRPSTWRMLVMSEMLLPFRYK